MSDSESFDGRSANQSDSSFISLCRSIESFCQMPVEWSESTATGKFIRICAGVITFVSVLFIFVQIYNDFSDRDEDRVIRLEERIERAWTRLLTQVGGNTGKGFALTVLLKESQDINKIDLSCKAIGGWDEDKAKCIRPAIFAGVDASDGVRLQDAWANFSGNHFTNSNLNWVPIAAENFADVWAVESTFSGSIMEMPPGAIFQSCDMSYAQIFNSDEDPRPAKKPIFFNCNMSGIRTDGFDLVENANLTPDMGVENWAWADTPPIFEGEETELPRFLKLLEVLYFCDPKQRKYFRDDPLAYRKKAVMGIWPQFVDSDDVSDSCEMTWKDAAARYPGKYPAVPK